MIDPIVLIQLGDTLVRVDRIEAIQTDGDGSLIGLASGACVEVEATPDDIRRKIAEAYELASEALS